MAAVLGVAAGGSAVTAAPGKPAPLIVRRASVTQNGQQIVWKVTLTGSFSPGALRPDKRTLCLLLERRHGAAVFGQVCAIGPPPGGRHPRLVYETVVNGRLGTGHVISSVVTRPNRSSMTTSFMPSSVGLAYKPIHWQVRNTLRAPPCVPTDSALKTCVRLYPRPPALADLHAPQVIGCVPSGAPFVSHGPSSGRMIAFTFDDGPWYDTPQFLNILERSHVPATFFEIGDQVSEYGHGGAIERRMLADGDMIGDHTWNHANVAGGGGFASGEIGQAAAGHQGRDPRL